MSTIAISPYSSQAFQAFLDTRSEPGWLIDLRRRAWKVFQEKPWPSRNDEEWRRTDIRLFRLDSFALPGTDSQFIAPVPAVLRHGVECGGTTDTANGHTLDARVEQTWADQGVVFGNLAELCHSHPDLVRDHLFQQAVDIATDKFSALHAACWSAGTLLYVPRNVCVDQPFHAHSVLSAGGADMGHTLVVLDEGAEATFLNELSSPSETESGLHCGATGIILRPHSRLRFVNLQDWGHKVWHFAHQQAVVERDASLQWTIGALGSRLSKVNQQVRLIGPGAETQVNGVIFTEGTQHISYHTLQHHVAPACRSDFLYKAALQDRSRTVWRGMIRVHRGAQKTDGYQRNDNLLLSHDARADAIPGLEIEADDVRCTHGATTGCVDEELVFYAQSRGYTRREAVRMVVTGFFQQVFDRITIENVREALAHAIARRVREYD